MTARVLNPVVLTELCKIRHPSSPGSKGRNLDRIKRDLFGPVNRLEAAKIFNEEVEKHQEKAQSKWGFDFRSGSPLPNSNQFVWERVSFNDFVPEMYTLSRAAHVRPAESYEEIASNYDILMDERAERENFINLPSCTSPSPPPTSLSSTTTCDIFCDESLPFKVPAAAAATTGVSGQTVTNIEASAAAIATKSTTVLLSCAKSLRKRQPKITEYMKQRKRLSQTPKKSFPTPKRMRTSTGGSSINNFFSPSRNR